MQFVITLVEHRILGFILSPYFIRRDRNTEYFNTYDKITLQKLPQYEAILSPEQVQLVKYIEYYNDQNLHKLFCKKKKFKPHDFMNSIDPELLKEHIRPYVEKQIARCVEIMQFNPVPIYHKVLQNKIYESDEIELVDEECETVFNFSRDENGIQYRLTIEHETNELILTEKDGIIIANEPCCLVLDDKLFVFKEIDSKKILPFFDKEYIQIPKTSEKKYFETFVKSAIGNFKVNASGFDIEHIESSPKSVLSLERNLAGHLVLVLKFIYNGDSIFLANRKSGMKVTCNYSEADVGFTCQHRDYELENLMISKLLSFGMVNKDGAYFEPFSSNPTEEVYGSVTWLNFNKDLLQNSGFEIAQKDLDKQYYLGKFELNFDVSEKENDWFDIEATIDFGEFKIPFVEFKEHISAGIREYVLPNNKVMILPEEWFESYSDLLNFSKREGASIKLQKQHFSILNNRIGKLSDDFRQNLKSLLSEDIQEPEEIPLGVNAKLRDYQSTGYSWMYRLYKNNFGACLADDMGLGKTLQTLTLLKKIRSENIQEETPEPEIQQVQLSLFDTSASPSKNSVGKASLIIVPTSLIYNWQNEVKKFVPSLKVCAYSGNNRGNIDELVKNNDLIISSYGIIRNDLDKLVKHRFQYLILDESQMIKNPGSKTYAAVIQLNADHKLVLSGTPIENSLTDLWAQFNFINPGLLGNLSFFQSAFQIPIEKHNDESKKERLQQLIAPFILRRTKQEVAKELPELSEQVIRCDMNEVQETFYEREKSKARNLVLENINSHGLRKASMQILQSLMRLRQIANHPLLVDENYISGSGKYDEVTRHMEILNKEGHKALIFSSFVGHLKIVSEWLEEKNIKYAMLTGESRNREAIVDEFQQNDDCKFFLISLKAGGVGLNLTAASYVLMLDPWWNPAAEKQAINRAHRIGQDKHVMVYRFIAQNSLEEKILKLQERKSELADIFVNDNAFRNISEEEILELFE